MSYYGPPEGGDGGGRGNRDDGRDRNSFNQGNFRDRSRSRDQGDYTYGNHLAYNGGRANSSHGSFHGQAQGGYGGGRGRGRGRGRGGGGYKASRPSDLQVSLNYFPIKVIDSELIEWVMYQVSILNVKRKRKKDPETEEFIVPPEYEFICKGSKEVAMDRFPEILLRRILNQLQKKNDFLLVTDGKAICYSNKRLFTKENSTSANRGSQGPESKFSAPEIYGPADKGGHHVTIGPNDVYNDYYISVKRNVEETDEDADKVRNQWFRVRLLEVAAIPFREVQKALQGLQQETDYLSKIKQATEVIMKSAQFAIMHSFGRSPHRFYFPEDVQNNIISEFSPKSRLKKDYFKTNPPNPLVPHIGLESSLKLCSGGKMMVNADTCLDYFCREYYPQDKSHNDKTGFQEHVPVPVLDCENRKIVDKKIENLDICIPDRLQDEVKSIIKKISFHVIYYRQNSDEVWLQQKRDLGWNEKKIRRANRIVRKNCIMKVDPNHKKRIIWSADDPGEYSFTSKPKRTEDNPEPEEVTHTIASYFQTRWGIKLRYPKMPCVCIGKNSFGIYEWYPLEFLFQAPGKKNPDNITDIKLQYYDEIAGCHRNRHIKRNYQKLMKLLEHDPDNDLSRQFGIIRIDEPITLKSKVLDEPMLTFCNQEAILNDGKWNLFKMVFKQPADLPSFAYINLTNDNSYSYISRLLDSMEKHGIILPPKEDRLHILQHVTSSKHVTRSPDPEEIYGAFEAAVNNAKNYFLFDKSYAYRSKNVWFKTKVLKDGTWKDCMVIPPDLVDESVVGIILEKGPTHRLHGKNVRIMAGCFDTRGKQIEVDPFALRYKPHGDGSSHERFLRDEKRWENCKFIKHIFRTEDWEFLEDDSNEAIPIEIIKPTHRNIETVAMIFVYLPSDDKQTYNFVKLMSQFEFGIPTQCCVEQKFKSQRNSDQFLSNISLKVNTKLMNSMNRALAWEISYGKSTREQSSGIPWINQTETLVVGISISHGLGQENISVIGASVGLDEYLMKFAHVCRLQSKSDIISYGTMVNMTKELYLHFYVHTGKVPDRVLVYRNGASDGTFDDIRNYEVNAMRLGLYEVMKETKNEFNCPISCKSGCLHCTPPITYVVSQTQHSICVVPKDLTQQKNVFSGTCIDDPVIMDYRDGRLMATKDIDRTRHSNSRMELFENVDERGYDFILTSHGGLKGTSKPVYYRVILNENAVWRPNSKCSPLTREELQICTYHQSYQYGTATKAVREVPVVKYSKRFSNIVLEYLPYIRNSLVLMNSEEEISNDSLKSPDNGPSGRKYFIHKKMNDPEKKILPECIREEILFEFSPFDLDCSLKMGNLTLRPPLRPHFSA